MNKNYSWMKLLIELNIKMKILNEKKAVDYKWTRIEAMAHISRYTGAH